MTSSIPFQVPNYSSVFAECTRKSFPQPGIIAPPLHYMAFVLVELKPDHDPHLVRNALVSLENIQVPPYTDANQRIFSVEPKPQPPPLVSVYTFATRSDNLLPESSLLFSIGFGYDLWVNKWDMEAPKGFMPFVTKINAHDKASKPFASMPDSNPMKKVLYDANFCIPEERVVHDICIQMKSSSKPLMQRVAAHIAYVLESQSIAVNVRIGFAKQRNQFGFFDAAPPAEVTANPTLQAGCVTRVWNTDKYNAIKNREKFGDQYVDLGRIATTFIGEEASNEKFINGTFGVVAQFIHDLKKWNTLPIRSQEDVVGRTKETNAFFTVTDPLTGTINLNWPRSHIVRVHIRGQKVVESEQSGCPFTWLRPSVVQNNTEKLEASAVPMQIYRQACSFRDEETGLQGLHFFGYTRDCNIVNAMFERMIGYASTLSDLPNADEFDPVIFVDTITGQKYWGCDKLLSFSKCIGTSYFYFPNMQQLLGLSEYPMTAVLKQPTSEESLNAAIYATKTKLRIGLKAEMKCYSDTGNISNLETTEIYRFLNNEDYSAPAEMWNQQDSDDSRMDFKNGTNGKYLSKL